MFLGGSMYLSTITVERFRCFGEESNRFELPLRPGLTALVGENDAGKTAVIDALRFVLGTTDQEWYRPEDTDFYAGGTPREIRIVCKFEALSARDKSAFVEYLTYGEKGDEEPVLYVNWTANDTGGAHRGRHYWRVELRSGKDADSPSMAPEVRELLRATYLRPLRDAEQALSAGRGSRLSQVLHHTEQIKAINLLFMACELLLLSQEDEGNKLLLIEEPEAHLHTQRQLQVMKSLQEQAEESGIQIVVTTHSPNLASAIELNNLVMIRNGRVKREALTQETWDNHCCGMVREIAAAIAGTSLSSPEAHDFLAWKHGANGPTLPTVAGKSRDNIYRYPHDDPKVLIRVGSIHSVKSKTHTATLVLETYWYQHNLESLAPWLDGTNSGGQSDGVRQQTRLKLHYVAMTRPMHLLCLAMKRSVIEDSKGTLDQDVMQKLKRRGWQIKFVCSK
jgi:AAA ATPase domain